MVATFLLFAIAASSSPPDPPLASAQASVRILPAARVTLGKSAIGAPYRLSKATVRIEDGTRRPARLVEFE